MKILLFLIASLVTVQAKKYNHDKEIFASQDRNTVVRVERIEGKLISQVYQFSEKKQTLVKVHTLTLEERMMPLNVDIVEGYIIIMRFVQEPSEVAMRVYNLKTKKVSRYTLLDLFPKEEIPQMPTISGLIAWTSSYQVFDKKNMKFYPNGPKGSKFKRQRVELDLKTMKATYLGKE